MPWQSRGLACDIFYLFYNLVHHEQDDSETATSILPASNTLVSKKKKKHLEAYCLPKPGLSWPYVNMIPLQIQLHITVPV